MSASQEPNDPSTMNNLSSQLEDSPWREPIRAAAAPESTLWRWLTEPVPTQWLLPLTGLWILGLDWLLFTQETIWLGLATPLLVAIGFVGGTLGTYFFQRRFAGDRGLGAWIKSLLAGIVVGIPIPLAGTVVGGWILLHSGLANLKDRLLRK